MLNLFDFVIKNSNCEFIHLVSGEDVLLSNDKEISNLLIWNSPEIFMELKSSTKHRFRVRFIAPHVEKAWQRKLLGKMITFSMKILDVILFTKQDYWFGRALLHKGLKDKAPLEDPNLSYNSGLRSA